uniref:C-type lectin domain-containing protein n=1 Tax=Erpetoichthys calabaricus TaxID=27687 RepID=A0A8C4RKI6_ERPCA
LTLFKSSSTKCLFGNIVLHLDGSVLDSMTLLVSYFLLIRSYFLSMHSLFPLFHSCFFSPPAIGINYTCPQLWRPFQSKCYFFSTVEMNWTLSQDNCTAMGGHLVIIESEDEQEFLQQEANNTQYWIGLTDSETEGKWLWVDKSPLHDPK